MDQVINLLVLQVIVILADGEERCMQKAKRATMDLVGWVRLLGLPTMPTIVLPSPASSVYDVLQVAG